MREMGGTDKKGSYTKPMCALNKNVMIVRHKIHLQNEAGGPHGPVVALSGTTDLWKAASFS